MIPKLALVFIFILAESEVLAGRRPKPGRKPKLPACSCPTSISLTEAFCPPGPATCTRPPMKCPLGKKCCETCKRPLIKHCLTPINPIKPGKCPKVTVAASVRQTHGDLDKAISRCGRPCKTDCDCDGVQKCCNAGICGKICMNPVKPKDPKLNIKKCDRVTLNPPTGIPGFPGCPADFAGGHCCCDGACECCLGNCCVYISPTCRLCQ